jgi:3-dehydroquinate synthase
MEDSVVSEDLVIQSHTGPYTVTFREGLPSTVSELLEGVPHFIIDANIARLYASELRFALEHPHTVLVEATEENKSLQRMVPLFERLVTDRVRRDHTLVAIGGGIVQDMTCFLASTLLRGLPWMLIPTTLLAQADSCIGSKSSINLGETKNILGTFNPPRRIFVHTRFLDTLEPKDVHSGVGEIIKVHAIQGRAAFDRLASDFPRLFTERATLLHYIRAALLIKQPYIEKDEFDRGIRNVFNYGHSFGHAMESATHYAIPHGVAVTMGMDMANHIAVQRGLLPQQECERMRPILRTNYAEFARTPIPLEPMLAALMKDKKNTTAGLRLVLPSGSDARIQMVPVAPDAVFRSQCERFLGELLS